MQTFDQPKSLQEYLINAKRQGKKIGFVPTMGNLHSGHLSLVELAKKNCDLVVVSIYVNPMQFGPNEDFDSYPRTLSGDMAKLDAAGTDIVFTPGDQSIYPGGKEIHTSVEVNRMTDKLCGASRPGHFRGVTTIVNILFNIVQPDIAVFGKKDYQQLAIIRAMVKDLMMPIEVLGGDIMREDNGLAMSSRNGFLSAEEKAQAGELNATLRQLAKLLQQGCSIPAVIGDAKVKLESMGFKIDYLNVVRQQDLEPASQGDTELLIAAAAWLGQPRLIDNIELTID